MIEEEGKKGIVFDRRRHALFTIESFRIDDENDYQYEIQLQIFFRVLSKNRLPGKPHCSFDSPRKPLALFSILKEVKSSPDHKMIKLLTFDNSFPLLRPSRQNS